MLYTIVHAVPPATPSAFVATGYKSHIDLAWQQNKESDLSGYKIYRSEQGKQDFKALKTIYSNAFGAYLDWLSDAEKIKTFDYKVTAVNTSGEESAPSDIKSAKLQNLSDEQFLDMTQRATFRYFWDYGHPVSGLARERNGSDDVVTTGGSGFGIMSILVGIERGYITRAQGLDRLVQIVSFLQFADRFHGVFPHWMNGKTGKTIPFSQYDDGADLVETSFLLQGLLTARQYFDKSDPLETDLRLIITQLWEETDYNWFRQGNANVLYWHWSPKYLWKMDFALRGFNEAHIVYILGKASPKHAYPTELYTKGWASSNYVNGQPYYGYKLAVGGSRGGPLFFSHYSYLGFDPRNKKDAYCNYFTRNQAHTYINRAYCIENPKQFSSYSADCWGLTASDNPSGYSAQEPNNDNGTISPTAALSSMPYTPKESLDALKFFYKNYGKKIFGEMGFYDAFNVTKNWFATSYLAIDQGPIIGMIENHRSGLLWKNFMKNPEIEPALTALGFQKDVVSTTETLDNQYNINVFPNPIQDNILTLEMVFLEKANLSINVLDFSGKEVKKILKNQAVESGKWNSTFDVTDLLKGILFLQVIVNEKIMYNKIITL